MEVLLLDPQGSPNPDKLVTAVETGMKYYKDSGYLRNVYKVLSDPTLHRADQFREAAEKLSKEAFRKRVKPDTLFFPAMAQRHLGEKKATMGNLQKGLFLLEQAKNRNAREETLSLYKWQILYEEARIVVYK